MKYTIDDVIRNLPQPNCTRLETPPYTPGIWTGGVGLAVESMKRHTTDEGWQIFAGLEHNGYTLAGYNLPINYTNVITILHETNPGIVVMQDKREWDVQPRDFREKNARFFNVHVLRDRPDIFKLTILKDSHQRPEYHMQSAREIGCHAWIIYYNPRVVKHLAPYIRTEHCIRTYHSLDATKVPRFCTSRNGALLSGAVSTVYPLRKRLMEETRNPTQTSLPCVSTMKHPGYHMNGTATDDFLSILNNFKVSICTASIFGYTLRKLAESTACGCVVLTDLPEDEVMPEIDGNLVRIHPSMSTVEIGQLLQHLYDTYDYERQKYWAERAKAYYDYRAVGSRLVNDIEVLRSNYPRSKQ